MKDHLKHICELIRDTFNIKRRPIPVTIHQRHDAISPKLKWTGIIVWCSIIFIISNLVIKPFPPLEFLNKKSSSVNLSSLNRDELSNIVNRLKVDNITIFEKDSSNDEFITVVWTKDNKALYDIHVLTDGQRLMIDPLIMSFMNEGFCYNKDKSSVYCPLNGTYIILIDSKVGLAQSNILFVYRSIKHQLYD